MEHEIGPSDPDSPRPPNRHLLESANWISWGPTVHLFIFRQHQIIFDSNMAALIEDPWKEPVTALFAGIGILYITLKIFSFWRLIASLFILPGTSVSIRSGNGSSINLTDRSSLSLVAREAGLSSLVLLMVLARSMPYSLQQRVSTSFWSLVPSRSLRLLPPRSSQSTPLFRPRLLPWISPRTWTPISLL